jgi:hypothetical protein
MARSIFEARQLIAHGHITLDTDSPRDAAGAAHPSGGRRGRVAGRERGAGYIVPVGSLISSNADVCLSAYLSLSTSVAGASRAAPLGPGRPPAREAGAAERGRPIVADAVGSEHSALCVTGALRAASRARPPEGASARSEGSRIAERVARPRCGGVALRLRRESV